MTEGTHRTITTVVPLLMLVALIYLAFIMYDAFSDPQMLPCDAECVEYFKQGNP